MRRSPDVTRLVDRLVGQGLVDRTPGEDDRRLSIARVTAAGLDLLRAIDPEMEALMAELTAALSERDKRELARLCDALVP
jgi:DNA-binding MarR family transcriptional regulator